MQHQTNAGLTCCKLAGVIHTQHAFELRLDSWIKGAFFVYGVIR